MNGNDVSVWLLLPFALLLIAIGAMPLLADIWWRKWYRQISVLVAAAMAAYYWGGLGKGPEVLHTLGEYFSFVTLGAALYIVTGGIHLTIKGRSRPRENIILLGLGAVLANFIGTTGASMLLLRPYLKNNRFRLSGFHVVFFIFIVSNVGGALTPIGDPPLFLGFIRGVPFFRVTQVTLLPWLTALGLLLGIFYALDLRSFRKVQEKVRQQVLEEESPARITGLHNLFFMAVVVGAVFITGPVLVREGVMLLAAAGSYFGTKKEIHQQNKFTFHPVQEIAFLFLAVFMTMMPAIDWLTLHAAQLGLASPSHFYWGTGALSGVLDNAPTYLNFLTLAVGIAGRNVNNPAHVLQFSMDNPAMLAAISCGAVFFGAMTYIGNAPNFMVKSTAESLGAPVPHFFSYILKYSLPVLLPVLAIIWLLYIL